MDVNVKDISLTVLYCDGQRDGYVWSDSRGERERGTERGNKCQYCMF